MIKTLRNIYFSFPIQLLLLSFKRQQFLVLFWIFLTIPIVGKFGAGLGIPSVFLDPEYLGQVDYLSFAVVGIGFGAMYVTWNIVMYILHSHRFPFMASLRFPLAMFFINNSIIPLAFIISYFTAIILFQVHNEFKNYSTIAFDLLGFSAGFVFMLFITGTFFGLANPNAVSIMETNKEKLRGKKAVRKVQFNEAMETLHDNNRVDYYVTNTFGVMPTRNAEHYDPLLYQLVFRRHHWNAFIAFICAFAVLISAGFGLKILSFSSL